MKKFSLLCCLIASLSIISTEENVDTQESHSSIEIDDTDISVLILNFIALSLDNDITISHELEELHQKLIRSEHIDQLTLSNALQEATTALDPLRNESEQADTLYQELQKAHARISHAQHKAAFAGVQVFDKLTVYKQLITYGPVSINSINNNPALSVNGQAIIDDLSVGTSNIANLNLGNVYGVTPPSPTQYVIINSNGTLGSTSGTSSTGTVTSVSGGNGITITGNPTINPTVNITAPVSIANGGTNATSMTSTNGVVYYDGSKLNTTSAGTINYVLTGNGAGVAPSFQPLSSIGAVTSVTAGQGINITGTASNPIVNINAPLSASLGGTGLSVITPHAVVVGEGMAPVGAVGPGNAGQLLIGAGSSADPSFVTPTAGTGLSLTTNASTLEYALSTPVSIANGGTNATSMTNTDGVVYYDGTKLNTTSVGTATYVLTSNGAGNAPSFQPVSGSGAVTSVTGGNGINITGTSTAPIFVEKLPVPSRNTRVLGIFEELNEMDDGGLPAPLEVNTEEAGPVLAVTN